MMLGLNISGETSYSVTGTTVTNVMKKTEQCDNLTLNVRRTEKGNEVSLKNFQILGFKNISISGIVMTDDKGNITGFENLKIKGCPAKVSKITGKLSADGADIHMEGKAAGMFKYTIHYVAK